MDFGTGAMMVCSYGDYDDVRHFRDLQLTPIEAINKSGNMTAAAGKYAGMSIWDARKAIIEADLVDCIISLPGQLFLTTQISACLWFITRSKNNNKFRRIRKLQTSRFYR